MQCSESVFTLSENHDLVIEKAKPGDLRLIRGVVYVTVGVSRGQSHSSLPNLAKVVVTLVGKTIFL